MKKKTLLVSLAALSLMLSGVAGCNQNAESKKSTPKSTQQTSKPASSVTPSSKKDPVPAPAANLPVEQEELYYSVPFGNGVEDGTDTKWEKGKTYEWTFTGCAAQENVSFAIGAKMTSSSHGNRSLYTNHDGASTSDPFESDEANDNTPRIEVKVNNVVQKLFTYTYSEAGLTNTAYAYFKVAGMFSIAAGDVKVTLTTNADCGYRLYLGQEARLYYPKPVEPEPEPEPVAEGYDITFAAQHCKVLVYESGEDYTVAPVELGQDNKTKSRDEDGNICKYAAADAEAGTAEVKPEVNFKLVADEGYYVDGNNISISGTMGQEWNKICSEDADIYCVTKIKNDITITINAVAKTGNEKEGYVGTFNLEHCTMKVYLAKKNDAGDNLDEADAEGKYYSRASSKLSKAKAQFNFEIFPEEGYEFVSGLALGGESSPAGISFITGNYGNFKVDKKNANLFSITKVASDLVINISCTSIPAGE